MAPELTDGLEKLPEREELDPLDMAPELTDGLEKLPNSDMLDPLDTGEPYELLDGEAFKGKPDDEDPEHFLHQYTGLQTGTHFSLATVLHWGVFEVEHCWRGMFLHCCFSCCLGTRRQF